MTDRLDDSDYLGIEGGFPLETIDHSKKRSGSKPHQNIEYQSRLHGRAGGLLILFSEDTVHCQQKHRNQQQQIIDHNFSPPNFAQENIPFVFRCLAIVHHFSEKGDEYFYIPG